MMQRERKRVKERDTKREKREREKMIKERKRY